MAEYKRQDREQLKEQLMKEMLETWQTCAALAIRVGISPKMANNLLMELRDENKIIMRRCVIDGHNTTSLFKIQKYDWFIGLRIARPDPVTERL